MLLRPVRPRTPSLASPASLRALPARFRRERVLIVGCGDVGSRLAGLLLPRLRLRVSALTSSPERIPLLRALGITPILGNLDQPASLARLAGIATRIVHLAPPPSQSPPSPPSAAPSNHNATDSRTRALLVALRKRSPARALVYGSTSGVYGDCTGAWVSESRPPQPQTARAQRRVNAEQQLRGWGRSAGVRVATLRIPGIYANDRASGTPKERLRKATPVLCAQEDVYTNHIHADDLARALLCALYRAKPQRIYNINDDTVLKMGDYFDYAADLYQLPRPPRITRAQAEQQLTPMLLSFMGESRCLCNTRMKRELRVQLRYPTVQEGLSD